MAEHIPPGPWDDFPEAWDIVTIGDRDWPGLASVDISRANKWDTKKAQKTHGAEREFKGADLASVKIEIRFWTVDHWDEIITELLPMIDPDPGKKLPTALTLRHVTANVRKVSQITIDSVTGPNRSGQFGVITIDATEHREPDKKNAGGKAKGAGNGKCAELAHQIEVLKNERYIYEQAFNKYMSPFTLDLVEAGRYQSLVAAVDVQIQIHQTTQQVLGCNQAGPPDPGGFNPADALLNE
jgi:hypothetical protein